MAPGRNLPGAVVEIGGRALALPPLSLPSLRRLRAQIDAASSIKAVPNDEQLSAIVDVIHAAAVRNYPELTREELEEDLDVVNAAEIFSAVLGASGFKKVRPADLPGAPAVGDSPPGEASGS